MGPCQRSLPQNKTNLLLITLRSSGPEVFCKVVVLNNFTKFTGKHLCLSIFFNKLAGKFVKFLRTSISIKYLWSLLLNAVCNIYLLPHENNWYINYNQL